MKLDKRTSFVTQMHPITTKRRTTTRANSRSHPRSSSEQQHLLNTPSILQLPPQLKLRLPKPPTSPSTKHGQHTRLSAPSRATSLPLKSTACTMQHFLAIQPGKIKLCVTLRPLQPHPYDLNDDLPTRC